MRALEAEAAPLRAKLFVIGQPAHVQGKAAAQGRLRVLGLVFGQLVGAAAAPEEVTSQDWVEVGRQNRARARAWGLAPERVDTEDFRRRDEQGAIG